MHQKRLMVRPLFVLGGVLLLSMMLLMAWVWFDATARTERIAIDSEFGLVKVNYLAPKTVIAQGSPANNKLLELSCPWAIGPKVLGSQGGGNPPGLTVSNAVGACAAPSCPASHPTLVANYCVPTGLDTPFTVVPTVSASVAHPPSPPLYHYVSGLNPTFYYHVVGGANASPYSGPPGGGGGTTGGGSNVGGNGSGGGGATGGSGFGGTTGGNCAQHTYAGGAGAWCGGSCPSNQVCGITGNAALPCACRDRDSLTDPNGGIAYDYPLLGVNTWGGPLHYGTYTSTGEPGSGGSNPPGDGGSGSGGSDTGDETSGTLSSSAGPVIAFSGAPASFAGPGGGTYSGGLYTPSTWWFATVGVCVNVCR